jgi:hypothetical protein
LLCTSTRARDDDARARVNWRAPVRRRTGSEIVTRAGAHRVALTVAELRLGDSLPARAVSAAPALETKLAAARDSAAATLDARAAENRARDAKSDADSVRVDIAHHRRDARAARCACASRFWGRRWP